MRQRRLCMMVLLGIGLVGIGICFFLFVEPWASWVIYYQREVPAMRAEATRIPGLTFRGVYDPHYHNELNPYVILDVQDHGPLILFHPDRTSFTGEGPLIVVGIGDCERTNNISVGQTSPTFVDVQFDTVAELVAHYDQVYQVAKRDSCTSWVWEDNMSLATIAEP